MIEPKFYKETGKDWIVLYRIANGKTDLVRRNDNGYTQIWPDAKLPGRMATLTEIDGYEYGNLLREISNTCLSMGNKAKMEADRQAGGLYIKREAKE